MSILVFLVSGWHLSFATSVITPTLQERMVTGEPQDIMVYFKRRPVLRDAMAIVDRDSRVAFVVEKLQQVAQSSQSDARKWLHSTALNHQAFFTSNSLWVQRAPTATIEKLARFSEVDRIGPDVRSSLDFPWPDIPFPQPPETPQEKIGIASHLKTIEADRVWDELGVRGEHIVVAGQDTGFMWQHHALQTKYRGYNNGQVDHNYNWLNATSEGVCSPGGSEPCDDRNHGTHTMGTMVGDDERGNRVGVAPAAQWIGCRNMHEGVGSVSSYMRCFDFFMAPYPMGGDPETEGRPDLAPHIVNNSWRCPADEGCQGDEFEGVAQAYKAAGILLVVAAGNTGPNCGTISDQPGRFAGDLLAVGGWNPILDEIGFFSGLGPSNYKNRLAPNLVAPGALVQSSVSTGVDHYDDKLGTSMASPQVAGVAALLWSHRPELIGQIDATIDILQRSATPRTSSTSCQGFPGGNVPNAVYGYGMLNAYQALTIK
jgi:subtilisin family serine protease